LELFTTYSREGVPTGLVPRAEVHRLGLWHKSAQVFIFDADGCLLVQRRAVDKDLYANLWDYSVGEHLHPEESQIDGARRGLCEELRISGVDLEPLGGERWVEIVDDEFADREIQQAYRGVYTGQLRVDPVEVAEVRYIGLTDLRRWIDDRPRDFTPWFLEDLSHLSNQEGFL
jgi:isopentenyl-diphosphate delta-isomerase